MAFSGYILVNAASASSGATVLTIAVKGAKNKAQFRSEVKDPLCYSKSCPILDVVFAYGHFDCEI